MQNGLVRKTVVIGIVMLFFGTSSYAFEQNDKKNEIDMNQKQNLYSEWEHQLSLLISPPTPMDHYQVQLTIDSSKIDYSQISPDGSDLRFTDGIGNPLPYWIEEWNPLATSVIWVNVVKAGTTTIIMYYGNTDVTSASNGDKTFLFFDDFFTFNSSKWESRFGYEPDIQITNAGEIKIKEKYGGSAHLYSTTYIPIETRTRYRIKQKQDGPNPPAGLYAGLVNMSKNALGDYIEAIHEIWFSEWRLCSGCNGIGNYDTLSGINTGELTRYYIDEYIWTNGKVEYSYNWRLKHIKTSNIPYNQMNLTFSTTGENTLICDWVMVTKYVEEPSEIIFFDDFDDNTKDLLKWTEIYSNGTWEEINKRTEFTLYEHPGAPISREGIESTVLNVTLSTTESVLISWQTNSDIGSSINCWSGILALEVRDNTTVDNWIKVWYNRGSAATGYSDNLVTSPRIIRYYDDRYDDTWNNEIQIFSDRYHIVMNNESTGWVYHSIFPSKASLKFRFYLDNSGAVTAGAYVKAAFDNIKVEIPEHGKQAPYPPRIEIVGAGLRYQNIPYLIPLKKYEINISATDPDFDDVYLYIETKTTSVGEWIGPVPSSHFQEITQNWKRGEYTIRIKAIDAHGYESIVKEQVIKVSWFWWFINLIKNIISLFNPS